MNSEKYNRSVALLCPTCGSSQFSSSKPDDVESELLTCASCSREITRDDLIRENSENVDEHIKEIGREVTKDLALELKNILASAFKGNQFIKIK